MKENKMKRSLNWPLKGSDLNSWIVYILNMIGSVLGIVFGVMSWIIKTLVSIFTIILIGGCIIFGVIYLRIKPDLDSCMETAYDKLASMSEDDFIKPMDTYIYDKDGKTVGIINAGNFKYAKINDISMNIQNGYISQEDKRFKEHIGIDLISTARAGIALIKNRGEITQGGSTITQQVIKNTYLTQEKSFKRKIIEILMAPRLEMKFSKANIMEYYCNTNYYGNRCYGVQAASQFYFGKDASDVSVAEAAMLVGLSNSPSMYDPIKHYETALEKRNKIIDKLCLNGYITTKEKEDAMSEPLEIVQKEGKNGFETYQSTYALHCAAITLMKNERFKFQYIFKDKEDYDFYIKQYDEVYNEKLDKLRDGGYKIYTSLDSKIQDKLQTSIDSILSGFDELQENGKFAMQGAAAVADNDTGYIVAVVGGRGTTDPYNRAYLSARQPGSAIKPLIDYTPAFDTGKYYPSKIMNDHEIENGPKNSGGGYRGNVTIREALNRSINTIAWQVLQEIGVDKGLSYLNKMRFHKLSYVDNEVDSLSIGGFTNGTRIVDMVKGYQTIANLGKYTDQTCIVDIKDSKDVTAIPNYKIETKQVYTPDSAYMMTDILKGTIEKNYGTGYGLCLNNKIPAAAKTGTTNNNKDTWFCGYTRPYTTSVWVGYDIPREMPGIYGATYAGKIWKKAMDMIHDGLEVKDWTAPETVYESFYNPETGEAIESETGLVDVFSKLNDIKAKEFEKEKQNDVFINEIKKQVILYENKHIAGPEDTYSIDEDFRKISNVLAEIDDTDKRTKLYNRIYEKYKDLLNIKDNMKIEIELYEKLKAEDELTTAIEAEAKAEKDRLNFIRKTRESNVSTAISRIEQLNYVPVSDSVINDAQNTLNSIKEYDSYDFYYTRLFKAIENIKTLPTYEEYEKQKIIRESEEAARKASEELKQNSMQAELDKIVTEENDRWKANESLRQERTGPGTAQQPSQIQPGI